MDTILTTLLIASASIVFSHLSGIALNIWVVLIALVGMIVLGTILIAIRGSRHSMPKG